MSSMLNGVMQCMQAIDQDNTDFKEITLAIIAWLVDAEMRVQELEGNAGIYHSQGQIIFGCLCSKKRKTVKVAF